MPSTQTLVADLNSGVIHAVGPKPEQSYETGSSYISKDDFIRYAYQHIDIGFVEAPDYRMMINIASSTAFKFSGRYLQAEDNHSTVGKLDSMRPIMVSGGFGGCAYKVFKSKDAIICTHIYKPSGENKKHFVGLMDSYAQGKNWAEVQSLKTADYIGTGGCSEVMVVSQLIGPRVDTILLKIGNGGRIIGKILYSDPIP